MNWLYELGGLYHGKSRNIFSFFVFFFFFLEVEDGICL